MVVKVINEQEVLQEGWEVLISHLEPSKVMKFWAACQLGEGDYLKLKEQLFEKETVSSLYEKIQAYHQENSK